MLKGSQGFASMDPAQQKALASKGGKAAHEKGTAHEWTVDEARAAGRKGGLKAAQIKHKKRMLQHLEQEAQRAKTETGENGKTTE